MTFQLGQKIQTPYEEPGIIIAFPTEGVAKCIIFATNESSYGYGTFRFHKIKPWPDEIEWPFEYVEFEPRKAVEA